MTSASLPPISVILGAMKVDGPCAQAGPSSVESVLFQAKTLNYVSAESPELGNPASPSVQFATGERDNSPPQGLMMMEVDLNTIKVPKPVQAETRHLPGKRWKQKRDQKYGLVGNDALFARLRISLKGLERAIPTESKTVLIQAIQRYLKQEVTPEEFAESIQLLVDEFHVVLPTGPAPDDDSKEAVVLVETNKRPAEPLHCTPHPIKTRPNKKAKLQEPVGLAETYHSQWEALLTVCSSM